ncbi:uncharacterized protein LOC128242395 [Mya arenaria]|uniref:uncharacterized protein LOC128242395 n=1 Tax=Mya arenaria TaxID=6604 RepID=UPI0022E6304E|nr:uncharacterized protein LOC128242395 [Mya arenaria]
MKPTFGMEGTKDCGMVIEDPREEKKRPKLAKYLAASLVGLVTVAGIVVLSVYIGTRISKGAYEGALRKYSDGDGRQVEEMITQKQDEVLVDVPNSVHMVYDYKHGLVFRRYTDMNTKKRGPCYAAYIGEMDPKPDTQFAEEGQMPAPTGEPEIKQQWRFTDNKVPSNLASSTTFRTCARIQISSGWKRRRTLDWRREKTTSLFTSGLCTTMPSTMASPADWKHDITTSSTSTVNFNSSIMNFGSLHTSKYVPA